MCLKLPTKLKDYNRTKATTIMELLKKSRKGYQKTCIHLTLDSLTTDDVVGISKEVMHSIKS